MLCFVQRNLGNAQMSFIQEIFFFSALPYEMGPILTSTGKLVRSFMRITSGEAYQ